MNKLNSMAICVVALCSVSLAGAQDTGAQAATPEQRVAMLKSWLQASQAQMRRYQWIETTTFYKGGEEKGHKQNEVYYGADGKLQKVAVEGGSSPPPKKPHGPQRRHAAEKAQQDLTDYMQQAAALVHMYIPPDPNRIQQAVNGGKMSVDMLQPGQRIRLDFHDYLKPGDVLGVEIEVPTNRLLGMNVSSYLDDRSDAVKLDVDMGVLADGTIYTEATTLEAPAKEVKVVIKNSGYRPL